MTRTLKTLNWLRGLTWTVGVVAHMTAGHAQIVSNGGFELPVVGPAGPITYSVGESFPGWTVDSGSVVLLASPSATGSQAVDLNGGLSQDIPTMAGTAYLLSLTARFGGEGFPQFLTVAWGPATELIRPGNPPQVAYSLTFAASEATTRLRFFSPGEAVTLDDVTVEPLPALSISRPDRSRVQISWSTNFARFVLESAATLPATAWGAVTNPPSVTGDHFAVTLDSASGQQFFRLRKAQN